MTLLGSLFRWGRPPRRLKCIQHSVGVWKCPRMISPDPIPILDNIPGPMDARFLFSVGLGFGTRKGRTHLFPRPALDKNRLVSPYPPNLGAAISPPKFWGWSVRCPCKGQIVGQLRKREWRQNVRKMSKKCPKKCPKIVRRHCKHNFRTFLGHFLLIWSVLLFGDPVQRSPVTTMPLVLQRFLGAAP